MRLSLAHRSVAPQRSSIRRDSRRTPVNLPVIHAVGAGVHIDLGAGIEVGVSATAWSRCLQIGENTRTPGTCSVSDRGGDLPSPAMDRPLHLLADLYDELGGFWLVEFGEAEQLTGWIDDRLGGS